MKILLNNKESYLSKARKSVLLPVLCLGWYVGKVRGVRHLDYSNLLPLCLKAAEQLLAWSKVGASHR